MPYSNDVSMPFLACEYDKHVILYVKGKISYTNEGNDFEYEFIVLNESLDDVTDIIQKLVPSTYESIDEKFKEEAIETMNISLTEMSA